MADGILAREPITLSSLPLELLPLLLEPLAGRRGDLASAALVSREWSSIANRLLYRWVRLWGRDLAIVPKLFKTLADSPQLCTFIVKLEVRVFPLSLILKERLEMEAVAIQVILQAVNLRDLLWTRKGALTDRVFEAIKTLKHLRSFELNAHTNLSPGSWDAEHLLGLPRLQSLSLILPDRKIASMLPEFFKQQRRLAGEEGLAIGQDDGPAFAELSLLCRESTIFNDRVFAACAQQLAHSQLSSLALAGCAKLTGAPLLDLIPTLSLHHLALEATAVLPSFYPLAAPHLTTLVSLKLTHPGPRSATLPDFFPSLSRLLEHTRKLRSFTLYHSGTSSTGTREWPVVDETFVSSLVGSVGLGLHKFECSGVLMRVATVELLAEGAPELRDLVVHLGYESDLDRLSAAFSHLKHLKTLHILSQRPDISQGDVLALASASSPTLRQIGFRNRVWHIRRTFSGDDGPQVHFVETAEAFGAFRRGRYGAEEDADDDD